MNTLLFVLFAFAAGYVLASWQLGRQLRHREDSDSVPERDASRSYGTEPPIPDRTVYDAVYTPEQRARNRRQLELMDEFAALQHRRNDLIRRAGDVGYEILDGPDMVKLKLETIAVLEKLVEFEPAGFYRDQLDDLLREFDRREDDTLQ